ncbi:MAG TPA: DUF4304 domain-containing protein [Polyangia bacterium]|jgi:hypothetical protein
MAKTNTRPAPKGPAVVARVKRAIVGTVVPSLRALGFEGSFPSFRRVERDRHSVIHFWWGRNLGWLTVLLAVVPPRKGTSVSQDYQRSIHIRNRQRGGLDDVVPWRVQRLFHFDHAAKNWGKAWPANLAELLEQKLTTAGLRWLEDPARRPRRRARAVS